jgi:hypothetical protein
VVVGRRRKNWPLPSGAFKPSAVWAPRAALSSGRLCVFRQIKLDFLDCLMGAADRAKLDEENFWLQKLLGTLASRCLLGRPRSASHPSALGYEIDDAVVPPSVRPVGKPAATLGIPARILVMAF